MSLPDPAVRPADGGTSDPEGASDAGARRAAPHAPTVSVLLPCRDAEAFLPACIATLERQTFRDFEVVAVDDGSRDGTRRVLERWARRDARVRVLGGTGEGPAGAALRAGGAARGRFLARMDADDLAHPRRLELQVACLEARPRLAGCGAGVAYFPRRRMGEGYRRYERWLNNIRDPEDVDRELFVECPLAGPTLLLRASAYRDCGGYREVGWPDDYDLVLRLRSAGHRLANRPEVLLGWRLHPGNTSRSSKAYAPDAFRRCKVHHLLDGHLPPDRPAVVWGAGSVGKALALELRRQGRPAAAFVDLDPAKIGQRIHGAPVWSPAELRRRRAPYVLAAVGSPGARSEIREALSSMGRRELDDFRALA